MCRLDGDSGALLENVSKIKPIYSPLIPEKSLNSKLSPIQPAKNTKISQINKQPHCNVFIIHNDQFETRLRGNATLSDAEG